MPITAVVVARDEADLLEVCLPRLGFADELLVLDMESSDDTRAVAERHGATVVPVPLVPVAEMVRNIGIDRASSDWVLMVDPDEVVPEGFARAIHDVVAGTSAAAFYLPYRFIAFGRVLHYGAPQDRLPTPKEVERAKVDPVSASWPRKLALLDGRRVRWPEKIGVHTEPDVDGEIASLVGSIEPIDHFAFRDVGHTLEKLIRYARSTDPALLADRELDPAYLHGTLFQRLVLDQGWRDGAAGVAVASLFTIGDWLKKCFDWERAGFPDLAVAPPQDRALGLVFRAHATYVLGRRAASRLRRVAVRGRQP